MASSYEATGGRIVVIEDNKIAFDTDRKSINLVPSAQIVTTRTVTFPDWTKRNAYHFSSRVSDIGGGEFYSDACDSFATVINQEWGPGRANALGNATLGSVPAGTDYIDVQCKLTRTVAPSKILGTTIPVMPPVNRWFGLIGGACIVEQRRYFARMFAVVLSGNTVLLRRYQSWRNEAVVPWRSDNAGDAANKVGWTHGGGSGSAKGWLVHLIQSRDATDGSNKWRTNGGCSLTDPTNYKSIYSVDLIITPGRRSI